MSTQRHAIKLLQLFNIVNIEKKSVSQAVSEYKPVIFFQRRDSVIKQMNKWSQNSVMKTIKILSETEEDSRNFPTLSDIIIERGLMKISTLKNK
jgi:DNA polymerase III delta subunit